MIRRRSAGRRAIALILFVVAAAGAGLLALHFNKPELFVLRLGGGGTIGSMPISTEDEAGSREPTSAIAPPPENSFDVISLRPLFNPDRLPPEEEAAPAADTGDGSLPDVVVTGIVSAGEDSVAILEPSRPGSKGQRLVLRKGDTLSGWTVDSIETDRIVLTKDEQREELVLKKDESPAPRRPGTQPNTQQQNQQRQRVIQPAPPTQPPARQ